MHHDNAAQSPPWWRVAMVWLVIGGPALVVLAGFATLALALHGGDRPLRPTSAVHADNKADTMTPATQARNHVAVPRR